MTMTQEYAELMKKLQSTKAPEMLSIRDFTGDDYELYSQSLSCYKSLFEKSPPDSVWESPSGRFEKERRRTTNLLRLSCLIAKKVDKQGSLNGKRKRHTKRGNKNKVEKLKCRRTM